MKRAIALLGLLCAAQVWAEEAGARRAFEQPVPYLGAEERARFHHGQTLFRTSWAIAPSADNEVDGLGPLFNRLACMACHPDNGRGRAPDRPGESMRSMLVRLSVPGRGSLGGPKPHPVYGDQLNEHGVPGVAGEGRAEIHWHDHEDRLPDGEMVRLRRPELRFVDLAYGPLEALTSPRVGPPVFGLGFLEAIPEAAILRRADPEDRNGDGISGRANWVADAATDSIALGRFGWKANNPTLMQQNAGAFAGDLGVTSPLFAEDNCTSAQEACRTGVQGGTPELTREQLDDITYYLAALDVPARRHTDRPQVRRGEALFNGLGCAACHVPETETGSFPLFPRLAGQRIHPYTDLLLHDMGEGLADGRPDFMADGQEWRTPPLWGIGRVAAVNEHTHFLHDGRARNFTEAILWHGGEAEASKQGFRHLSRKEREAVIAFLGSL